MEVCPYTLIAFIIVFFFCFLPIPWQFLTRVSFNICPSCTCVVKFPVCFLYNNLKEALHNLLTWSVRPEIRKDTKNAGGICLYLRNNWFCNFNERPKMAKAKKKNNNSNEMFINGAGESCPYIQDM